MVPQPSPHSFIMARAYIVFIAITLAASIPRAAAGTCKDLTAETKFPSCVDAHNGYAIAWQADSNDIWLAIDTDSSDPNGFAGFGLSEAGGMKGADLVAIERTGQGLRVHDLWSTAFAAPSEDDSQDVVLVSPLAKGQVADAGSPSSMATMLTEKPGRIRALLRRSIHSCDPKDLSIKPGIPQSVVWSLGANWPSYHGPANRGNIEINFIPLPGDPIVKTPPAAGTPLPPDTYTMDLTMPNVTIPQASTAYLCTHFHLPDDKRYQIIAHEALIRSPHVHHIVLYGCNGRPPAHTEDVFDCLMTEPQCSSFVLAWAPGVGYVEMPPAAGFPFGAGQGLSTWFALQVHYDNRDNLVIANPDTSGLRITYTSNLRPYDMDVLLLGQTKLELPPGQLHVVAPANVCPSECTQTLKQPLRVYQTFLHMHQLGSSIVLRHIRDGVELEPLGRRSAWDFNFQKGAYIQPSKNQLLPGDTLITECTYNTVRRTNVTHFGEGTQDEMCIAILLVYPRTGLTVCTGYGDDVPYAICGDAAEADKPRAGMSQQDYIKMLASKGLLVNVTHPTFTDYKDPLCPGLTTVSKSERA